MIMTLASLITLSFIIVLSVGSLCLARLLWILPIFRTQDPPRAKSSAKLVIVLGSGGHTAEMLRLIENLDFDKYISRLYVISSGDILSESKARAFESRKGDQSSKKVRIVVDWV